MSILTDPCPKCFRKREEARTQPLNDQKICGSCAMDVDSVVGWLEFVGYQIQRKMPFLLPNGEIDGPALDEALEAANEEPPKPPTKAQQRADNAADASEAESKVEK